MLGIGKKDRVSRTQSQRIKKRIEEQKKKKKRKSKAWESVEIVSG